MLIVFIGVLALFFLAVPSLSAIENPTTKNKQSLQMLEEFRKEARDQEKKRYISTKFFAASILKSNSKLEIESVFSDTNGELVCIEGTLGDRENPNSVKYHALANGRRYDSRERYLKLCGCILLFDMRYASVAESN